MVSIGSDAASSTEGLGTFTGTITYVFDGDDKGTLTVSLANTSAPANGGFLTGFLFNWNSSDPNATIAFQQNGAYPGFKFASGNGAPFGKHYEAGAALNGNFLGGGSPQGGIPVGGSADFVFTVMATDADQLDASSFLDGPYQHDFIVRFKGFANGGSDKVPVEIECPADLNGDGVVDQGDLELILLYWGMEGSGGDVNGDGVTDEHDLRVWLVSYGPCP